MVSFLLGFGAVSFGISAWIMARATYFAWQEGGRVEASIGLALTTVLAYGAIICAGMLLSNLGG
jgi:hypothetical protein